MRQSKRIFGTGRKLKFPPPPWFGCNVVIELLIPVIMFLKFEYVFLLHNFSKIGKMREKCLGIADLSTTDLSRDLRSWNPKHYGHILGHIYLIILEQTYIRGRLWTFRELGTVGISRDIYT